MSGVESLVTQVKQGQNGSVQYPAPPPPQRTRPLTIDTESNAAPSQSCFSRLFCCCRSNSLRRQSTKQQPPTAQGAFGGNQVYTAAASPTRPAPPAVPDNGRYPGQNYLLQPLRPELKGKKTLVLDLDETLVHSSFKYIPDADFEITIELAGALHRVYVRKRPGVHRFLEHVARRWEVVIFTASLAKYADPLLDVLDRTRVIDARLFRESCVRNHDSYVKDLSMLGRRMQDTTIIDNSPLSYMFQPNYAIPITTWFSDPDDRQLYDLLPFLDALADAPDVADVLYKSKLYFASGGYIPPANGQIPGLPPMGLANYYDDEEFTPAADETAAFTNGYAGGSSQHYAVPVQPPPPPPMPAPPRAPLPPPPYTVPAVAPPPPPVAVDDDGAVDDSGGNETPSGGSESQNHALPDVPIHA